MKKIIEFPTSQQLKEKCISQDLDEILNDLGIYDEELRILAKKEIRGIAKMFSFNCPKISDSSFDESQVRLVAKHVETVVIPKFIDNISNVLYDYIVIKVKQIEKEYYGT